MSPDLEWRVDDSSGNQTIAKTTPPRSPRWRLWAIGLVVILGVAWGVIYRSIPEPEHPAPTPTPPPLTPAPTIPPAPTHPVVPARLRATIDAEAVALADGDAETYLSVHVPVDDEEAHWRRSYPQAWAWGYPTDSSPLYFLVDYNLRTASKAWADIRQYRNGRWFRETRFYQWVNERWLRSDPDPFFWQGKEEKTATQHFTFTYAVEDRDLVKPFIKQLDENFQTICRDLGCATAPHEVKLSVTFRANEGPMIGGAGYFIPVGGEKDELRIPSPRVMGFFESGQAYDPRDSSMPWLLAHLVTERVAHGNDIDYDHSADVILQAIAIWAASRLDSGPESSPGISGDWGSTPASSLEALWGWAGDSDPQQTYNQALLLIRFIEQKYGASSIARLLKGLSTAKSLSEAIETGLSVKYSDFNQKWLAWLKQSEKTKQ